jgi:hypothetical protein
MCHLIRAITPFRSSDKEHGAMVDERFEVLAVMLLRIHNFLDVTFCSWVSSS